MSKIIISCAITGSIHTPSMSPYLPVTADQIDPLQGSFDGLQANFDALRAIGQTPADTVVTLPVEAAHGRPDAAELSTAPAAAAAISRNDSSAIPWRRGRMAASRILTGIRAIRMPRSSAMRFR